MSKLNLYYFTHIRGLQKIVQPVYAKNLDHATEIIESQFGNRYATAYSETHWPIIQARMEKRIGTKLTIREPLNAPKEDLND